MSKTRLVIYVCNASSNVPLPQYYLSLPDVQVLTSPCDDVCTRCRQDWAAHAWVATTGIGFAAIDCSEQPREVTRTGFYPA